MADNIKTEDFIFTDNGSSDKAVLGTLEGPCADFVDSTRNGRHYTDELWEKVFADGTIASELIENGGIPGEMDHPADREETDSSRIAILMKDKPKKKDGKLWAKFQILNTPLGKIAYTLAKAGFNLGISSRGSGDTYTNYDGEEYVDEDTYDFKAFDLVLVPAVKDARLHLVTEGLQEKFDYKKALTESLNSAKEEEKKVMLEELDKLGIKLTESASSQDVLQAVVDHFGTLSELDIYNGPTYILPDGSFLDLRNQPHHSVVERWLIDNGLSNEEYIETAGSQTLYDLGCIRCDYLKNYIALCSKQPTRNQYNSLLVWLDELSKTTRNVQVISPTDQAVTYWFNEYLTDDVVERIKRYYSSGRLYEKVDMSRAHSKLFDRRPIGEELNTLYEEKSSQEGVDIDAVVESDNATNDGSSLVEELQTASLEIQKLQEKVGSLQEKLSVCYAKEYDYKGEIERHKKTIARLIESNKTINPLKKRVEQLTEELDSKNKSLQDSDSKAKGQDDKVKSLKKEASLLRENLSENKKLSDNLKEQLEQERENTERLASDYEQQIEALNEQLISEKKDSAVNNKRYSDKLEKANQLVEKYKKIAKASVERYIDFQATKLGVPANQIKSRLGESYTFDDIDSICEDIQDYRLGLNSLPFRQGFTTGTKMKVTESLDTTIPLNEDDKLDDTLLSIVGLK